MSEYNLPMIILKNWVICFYIGEEIGFVKLNITKRQIRKPEVLPTELLQYMSMATAMAIAMAMAIAIAMATCKWAIL